METNKKKNVVRGDPGQETRTQIKGVRLTIEEAQQLEAEAEKEHMKLSELIRIKLFTNRNVFIPYEVRSALGTLLHDSNRIAGNIHSVVKGCQFHKSVDAYDVKKLTEHVDELRNMILSIYELMQKGGCDGSDEAPPDQGGEGKE